MRIPHSGTKQRLSPFQMEMIREKVRDEITMRGRELCWYCEKGVHHETQIDDCECECHVDRQQELRRAA